MGVIGDELISVVFPHLASVLVEDVCEDGGRLVIMARTVAAQVTCPACQVTSDRVHVRYQRRLADTASVGRGAVVVLTVRRFRCVNPQCVKRTFAEQVPGLSVRYGRATVPMIALLERIAAALAGRAGSRLCAALGLVLSRTTLLRLLCRIPIPAVTGAPKLLGVDDFALRRGHVYATILVDLATHRPVDVLPDREAATLSRWLVAHPGAEVICRDRAPAYAQGAREGAPQATHVADRWHLWHNLAEAVELLVSRHRAILTDPPAASSPPAPVPGGGQPPRGAVDETTGHGGRPERRLVSRTRKRFAEIHALLAQGLNRTQVSQQLGLFIGTVRRFANAASVEQLLTNTVRQSILDPYKPYLAARWAEGATNLVTLHTEIQQRGYRGGVPTIRRFLQPRRLPRGRIPLPTPPPTPASDAVPTRATVKPRQVVNWLTSRPEDLTPEQASQLQRICDRSPDLTATAAHIRDFATMMTTLTGTTELPQWIHRVLDDDLPELHTFVHGMQRDLDAVTNGLSLPHSSGMVEGHVNRIKTIKRQMYGRAGFDLLRRRILLQT